MYNMYRLDRVQTFFMPITLENSRQSLSREMIKRTFLGLTLFCSVIASATEMIYAPAPLNNPLKGLVPYSSSDAKNRFPHSMEFRYFPMHKIMSGPDRFDWTIIEEALTLTQANGCQLIFRVYVEYPGKGLSTPGFLVNEGLKITTWKADDGISHTPDYTDARLIRAIESCIHALGKKYDGDPRVGFITAGFLGSWGEWHTYPKDELWASKDVQSQILDAYEKAFKTTPILLRYPAGKDAWDQADNSKRPFGYHDDSFEWATLHTGIKKDDWFFEALLRASGTTEKWKQFPIGGELRPELWKQSFTIIPHKRSQGFSACVASTHASWLMDSGLFEQRYPMSEHRSERANLEVRKMGYEYHIATCSRAENVLTLVVENRGVAPFYYDWPVELALFNQGILQASNIVQPGTKGILPGEPVTWRLQLEPSWTGEFRLRIPNPMPGGKPLRFANQANVDEWTILGSW